MTLTRFLMSSVAFVAISVAGSASVKAADIPGVQPQVLGSAPADMAAASAPSDHVPTAPDMPPPPASATLKDVPSATPTPSTAALASPGAPTGVPMPVPAANPPPTAQLAVTPVAGAVPPSPDTMQPVSGDSGTKKIVTDKKSDKPDAYYDSRLNVPTGPLANSVGPRKVDPTQEPGSKYVVAKKNYKATDTEALLVSANRALDLDRNDAALEMFDDLYKRNKRDPRILMGRAVAQQKLGHDDLAIVSYQALLDTDPKNSDAIINMMGLLQKQYPAVALRRLTDLQNKYPGNPGIAAQLGMTYAQMGNNKDALKSLSMAASMEPNNAQHEFNMAIIYDRLGDKPNALKYYQEALETDAVYGGSRSIPRDKVYDRLAKLRQ